MGPARDGRRKREPMQFYSEILLITLPIAVLLVMIYLPRLLAGVPFVEPMTVIRLMDNGEEPFVLDLRQRGDFLGPLGHLPEAFNVPFGDLWERFEEIRSGLQGHLDAPIYIICGGEDHSSNAARLLKRAGFTNISIIKGGMKRWAREGLPVDGAKD